MLVWWDVSINCFNNQFSFFFKYPWALIWKLYFKLAVHFVLKWFWPCWLWSLVFNNKNCLREILRVCNCILWNMACACKQKSVKTILQFLMLVNIRKYMLAPSKCFYFDEVHSKACILFCGYMDSKLLHLVIGNRNVSVIEI